MPGGGVELGPRRPQLDRHGASRAVAERGHERRLGHPRLSIDKCAFAALSARPAYHEHSHGHRPRCADVAAARPARAARRRRSIGCARLRAALGPTCPRLLHEARRPAVVRRWAATKSERCRRWPPKRWRRGADTLITCGGVQSNHARVTAAAGAALGLRVDARAERRARRRADRPTRGSIALFGADDALRRDARASARR